MCFVKGAAESASTGGHPASNNAGGDSLIEVVASMNNEPDDDESLHPPVISCKAASLSRWLQCQDPSGVRNNLYSILCNV